jgi:hypothetical protein
LDTLLLIWCKRNGTFRDGASYHDSQSTKAKGKKKFCWPKRSFVFFASICELKLCLREEERQVGLDLSISNTGSDVGFVAIRMRISPGFSLKSLLFVFYLDEQPTHFVSALRLLVTTEDSISTGI